MLGLAFVCVGFVSVEGVVRERWSPRGSNTKVVTFMCFMTSTKKHNKDASPLHNSRHSATFTATKNFIDFVFQTMGIALLPFSQPRDLPKLSTMNRHIICLVRKDVAKLCISRCPFNVGEDTRD